MQIGGGGLCIYLFGQLKSARWLFNSKSIKSMNNVANRSIKVFSFMY